MENGGRQLRVPDQERGHVKGPQTGIQLRICMQGMKDLDLVAMRIMTEEKEVMNLDLVRFMLN